VVLGLIVGKTVGIFAGTYLAVRFTPARLNPDLAWADVLALAVLAGIGFTVALLIGELAFPAAADAEHVKAAVLAGSLIAAALAGLLLTRRDRIYRRLWEAENVDCAVVRTTATATRCASTGRRRREAERWICGAPRLDTRKIPIYDKLYAEDTYSDPGGDGPPGRPSRSPLGL
jgi:hypothetical protein